MSITAAVCWRTQTYNSSNLFLCKTVTRLIIHSKKKVAGVRFSAIKIFAEKSINSHEREKSHGSLKLVMIVKEKRKCGGRGKTVSLDSGVQLV